MINTWRCYKTTINNFYEPTDHDKAKNTILQLATKIHQTALETGWSVDSKYIDQTGQILLKHPTNLATNLWRVKLNHVSGSCILLQLNSAATSITHLLDLRYAPQNTQYDIESMSSNIFNNGLFPNYFPSPTTNNLIVFIGLDTQGSGICIYSGEGFFLLGSLIQKFCYSLSSNAIENTLMCLGYNNHWIDINYLNNGTWLPGFFENSIITPTFATPETTTMFTPILISSKYDEDLNEQKLPYGFISTNCLVHTSTAIDKGYLLNNGNYLAFSDGSQGIYLALGWSPYNTQENNPWYIES